MRFGQKSLITTAIAFAVLAIPVAISSAGTASSVKVPVEQNTYCSQGFSGKHSVVGSATFTRLKNGDVQITFVVNKSVPTDIYYLYPFYVTYTSATTWQCHYLKAFYTQMKLDSSGSGRKTFTLTGVSDEKIFGV
jgi:hypothetical protein